MALSWIVVPMIDHDSLIERIELIIIVRHLFFLVVRWILDVPRYA
jgi:hypothetical protein